MARTDGYSEYACDVRTCDAHDFAQEGTDRADAYSVRRRYDDNGVMRELMLCPEHGATYSRLVGECERAYQALERDGSYELATMEQVAELEAQVAKLQEDYAAMRKNRDLWVTKYNALSAEFEEYKRTHPDTEGNGEE